ncbi:MAG: hypothetical protein ABIJ09_05025, partial [Pseudomonadota bacterium]
MPHRAHTQTRALTLIPALALATLQLACPFKVLGPTGPSEGFDCSCNQRGVCEPGCSCDPDCERDAGASDSVGQDQGQVGCGTSCTDLIYDECTCGVADPCGWIGDGYCDLDPSRSSCLGFTQHFDDAVDCRPASDAGSAPDTATVPDSGTGLDAGPSDHATGVDQTSTPDTGTDSAVPTDCPSDCSNMYYTACSCSAADPCGWSNDGYCDLDPPSQSCAIYSNHFDDSQDCLAVTDAGSTVDASTGVDVVPPQDAGSAGDSGPAGGFVAVSNPVQGRTDISLNSVWGVVASWSQTLWAVGSQGTVLTWDGNNWTQKTTPTTQPLYGVVGTSTDSWFVSGLYTTLIWTGSEFDHGTGWAGELVGVWGDYSTSIYFLHRPTSQYVQCSIMKWNGLEFESSQSIEPSCLAIGGYGNEAWVGTTGGIYYNFGGGWNPQTADGVGFYTDVFAADADNVWMSGTQGLVAYDSHFQTWNRVNDVLRPNGEALNGVWASSASDLWVVGDDGLIAHYDGNGWSEVDNPLRGTGTAINDIWGSTIAGIWVVGDNGSILHRP